jgi:hypothetical protein
MVRSPHGGYNDLRLRQIVSLIISLSRALVPTASNTRFKPILVLGRSGRELLDGTVVGPDIVTHVVERILRLLFEDARERNSSAFVDLKLRVWTLQQSLNLMESSLRTVNRHAGECRWYGAEIKVRP